MGVSFVCLLLSNCYKFSMISLHFNVRTVSARFNKHKTKRASLTISGEEITIKTLSCYLEAIRWCSELITFAQDESVACTSHEYCCYGDATLSVFTLLSAFKTLGSTATIRHAMYAF